MIDDAELPARLPAVAEGLPTDMQNRGFLRVSIAGSGGNSKEKPMVYLDCRLPAARKREWLANHFSLKRVRHSIGTQSALRQLLFVVPPTRRSLN